jgi:pyruvate formate lyase activating enzyme
MQDTFRTAWENVRGFEPVSLCDWPGHVCAVLFLGGCNLLCPTCHNHQLAWTPGTVPVIPRSEVLGYLDQKAGWLDGITVTGGEPTVAAGLSPLLSDLRAAGLKIKLDTNGMRPDVVRGLLEQDLAQVFAVDVKGPWDRYFDLTGGAVDENRARAGLESVFALAVEYPDRFYFRCTQVPGLNENDLEAVRAQLPAGFSLRVQKFIPPVHAGADQEDASRHVA